MRRSKAEYGAILAQINELEEELNELDPDEREIFDDRLGGWIKDTKVYKRLKRLPDEWYPNL